MKLSSIFLAFALTAFAQQPISVNLVSPAPPAAVPQVNVVGNSGNSTYNYIVVANYPSGSVIGSPVTLRMGPTTLSGSNYVQIGWQALSGAISYDVLRLTPPNTFNGSTCACAVATGLTTTTTTDTGTALTSYTAAAPAKGGSATLYVNTKGYDNPQVRQAMASYDIQASVGVATTLPTYCSAGDTVVNTTTSLFYICNPANTWLAVGGVSSLPISPLITTVADDGMYNAFPGITTTRDGVIVFTYKKGALHIGGSAQIISRRATRNPDGTLTLGAEVEVEDDPVYTSQGTAITRLANGNLLTTTWLYDLAGATSIGPGYAHISTDGGLTWSGRYTVGGCSGYVNISSPAIQLPDGTILQPVFGQDSPSGLLAARLQQSTDGGVTWTTRSTMLTGNNAIEVSVVRLTNGHIIATYRNQGSNLIGRNLSTDDGLTWGAYTDEFPGASPAQMIQKADGSVLTVYRSQTAPTISQMGFRLTYDEGASWPGPEQQITNYSNPNFEYAAMTQLPDGIGVVWAAQSDINNSDVYFTVVPNSFGPVPFGFTSQGITSVNGDVAVNGGDFTAAAATNVVTRIYIPGVQDALGTGGIEMYPHGGSGAWGAGMGVYAAAHATLPGTSYMGTGVGGFFGVSDTARATGNNWRLRVFNGGNAIVGPGGESPAGVAREFTVRATNSSNQVAYNCDGFVIVDSSPCFFNIYNNGTRTAYVGWPRSGSNDSADYELGLATAGSINVRMGVSKTGSVGLGGPVSNLLGVAKESTIASTAPGTQVAFNLNGYASSGNGSPGFLNFYNNSVRTAFVIAPRSGADNSADMEFYTSSGGVLSRTLALDKSGKATVALDVNAVAVSGGGTIPAVSTCGSIGTGSKNTAGFITSNVTGACVSVLTFSGYTAATGWSCGISNGTTANLITQTGSSTTTATFTGVTVSGDILRYVCAAY